MRPNIARPLITKIFASLLLVWALIGCSEITTVSLTPYPDVNVIATARKVSYHHHEISGKTTSVHFRYLVTARSDAPLYFKVDTISVNINGQKNESAYYDSVASILPRWEPLKKGETVLDVYAVFPGTIDATTVANVKFMNLGFSRNPEKKSRQ